MQTGGSTLRRLLGQVWVACIYPTRQTLHHRYGFTLQHRYRFTLPARPYSTGMDLPYSTDMDLPYPPDPAAQVWIYPKA